MAWILADGANPEVSQIIFLLDNVLGNPITIVCLFAMTVMVIGGVLDHRYKLRKAEIEATLKQEMIQRGMTAEDIERVLAAKGDAKGKTGGTSAMTKPS